MDGQPRFGGGHRYQRATTGRQAVAGGGAFHTAKLTITGRKETVVKVSAIAKDMGLRLG